MLAYRISAQCPKCGGELITRRNKGNGNRFLGCIAYPLCNFSEPLEPILAALMHEREEQEQARDLGASFETVQDLRCEIAALKRVRDNLRLKLDLEQSISRAHATGARGGVDPDELSRRIRQAIAVLHPDRWDNGPAAEEASKQLNNLRQFCKCTKS